MEKYKIGIVGGGAAGLMAAISASEAGCPSVVIFESNVRCGTKILMSGGSRCNVTNKSVTPGHFFGGNKNFIKNVLNGFNDKETLRFFERLGVALKLEPTGKFFPVDDKASSVLNAMLGRLNELNVKIFLSEKIETIKPLEDGFIASSKDMEFFLEKVILTSGGKSYPTTGSDGSGYSLAKSLKHSIITPFPALTPVLLDEPGLTKLSGVTIPARLTIFLNRKKHIEEVNSLLLTHFGISGPAPLNISREIERLKNEDVKLLINFIPDYTYDSLSDILKDEMKRRSDKKVIGFFKKIIPSSLCECLFDIAGIAADKKFYSLSNEEIKKLSKAFTSYELSFKGVRGFQQAEVTAGGVPLDEVRYQTMESKLQKGLYLAGEILDCDGIIGGYNFQWAWSTGFIAGKSAAKE